MAHLSTASAKAIVDNVDTLSDMLIEDILGETVGILNAMETREYVDQAKAQEDDMLNDVMMVMLQKCCEH